MVDILLRCSKLHFVWVIFVWVIKLNALYNCVIKWRCLFYNIFKSFTFRANYLFVKITVTGQSFTIVTVRPNSIVAIIFNIFLCRWAILFISINGFDHSFTFLTAWANWIPLWDYISIWTVVQFPHSLAYRLTIQLQHNTSPKNTVR